MLFFGSGSLLRPFSSTQTISGESPLLAAVNVVLGGTAILCIYLFPMYLVGHWHAHALVCLDLAAMAVVG